MSSKNLKRSLAAVAAVAMLAGAVAAPISTANVVSAGEVLGETSFEYKALPWHTCESSPAKQTFSIEDGTFHVKILKASGADKEKWDLQVRHRNLVTSTKYLSRLRQTDLVLNSVQRLVISRATKNTA